MMNAYAAAVYGFVVLISGCAITDRPRLVVECGWSPNDHPPGTPALVGKEYGVAMSPIPLDAVVFTDEKLTKRIGVQSVYADRTSADTVAVGARFVNCTDQQIHLGVRTSFMDGKQRPTEKPSIWKTVFVQPRATAIYNESSIGRSEVAHYLVEIRDGSQ